VNKDEYSSTLLSANRQTNQQTEAKYKKHDLDGDNETNNKTITRRHKHSSPGFELLVFS